MTLTPNCPICESKSSPLFYSAEHRMFRCDSCSLSFVHPIPTDEFLCNFYSQYHNGLSVGGEYELVEDRMQADFNSKIAILKMSLTSESDKILDVGCGKGFFAKSCLDAGLQIEGIDLSDTAVDFANNKLSVKATCGKIEDLSDSIGPYDAVTFWATIEHLRDPLATLLAIKKVLKPNGILIMDTGIGNDWLDKLLPGFTQWYDPPQHLFVFSENAIISLLEKAGFTVKSIDTCFERTWARRIARILRGFLCAFGMRTVAELTRTKGKGPFLFTRFPLGNLMSIVAQVDD